MNRLKSLNCKTTRRLDPPGDLGVHGKKGRQPGLGGGVAVNVEESLRSHVIDGDVAEFRLGLFFEEIVFRLLQDGAQILNEARGYE